MTAGASPKLQPNIVAQYYRSNRKAVTMQFHRIVQCGLALLFSLANSSGTGAETSEEPWIFVSMPDFLNVDTDYP